MNIYGDWINIYILGLFHSAPIKVSTQIVNCAFFGGFEFFQFLLYCMLGTKRVIINPSTQWTLSRQLKINLLVVNTHKKKNTRFFLSLDNQCFQKHIIFYIDLSPLGLCPDHIIALFLFLYHVLYLVLCLFCYL